MTYYFYCPHCGYEETAKEVPKGAVGNIRDGWGMPIYHYECPECHNLDAGYMCQRDGSMDEKVYYRSVIGLYQGVRGFKNEI